MFDALLKLAVPSDRDRRALDETVADWRIERAQHSGAGRLAADVCGLAACARALAGCVVTPCARPDIWRYFGVTTAVSIAIGIGLAIEPVVQWGRASTTMPMSMWFSLLPGAASAGMLLSASAGFGLKRGHQLPVATAAVGTAVLAIIAIGWIVPAANQQFREVSAIRSGLGYRPPPGTAEMLLPQLVSNVVSSEAPRLPARRELAARISFVGMCVALVGFGEAVRRRLMNRCRWWIAKVAAMVGGAALVLLALEAGPTLVAALPPEAAFYAFEFHVDRLAAVPAILCLTWWLARSNPGTSDPRTPEPLNPNPVSPEPRHPGT